MWPLAKVIAGGIQSLDGGELAAPFKVPPTPKMPCFFQHLQHLPDAQDPRRCRTQNTYNTQLRVLATLEALRARAPRTESPSQGTAISGKKRVSQTDSADPATFPGFTEQKGYVTASGLLLIHMISLPWGWREHSEGLVDSAFGPHVTYFSRDYL